MQGYVHNLQALRGAACLLVVAYHAAACEGGFGVSPNLLRPALWFGYAGVDLFFVLSGFIIATTNGADLGRAARLPGYLFRRAWRIYPTYWAALAVAVGVHVVADLTPLDSLDWARDVPESVLLVPAGSLPRFLPVAWTLMFELMFYAAFASLFLLPRRAAVPALCGWAAAVLACSAAGHRPQNRVAALAVDLFVLEFLAGVLVAWRPVRLSRRAAAGVVLIGAAWWAGFSVVFYDPDPSWLPTTGAVRVLVFGIPAALVVAALVGAERAGWRAQARWLGAIGNASYSVYLLHGPLLLLVTYLTIAIGWSHQRLPHAGWVVVMLAGVILPGMLFHRFVERPLLNLARRRPAERPAVPLSEPTPLRRAA